MVANRPSLELVLVSACNKTRITKPRKYENAQGNNCWHESILRDFITSCFRD